MTYARTPTRLKRVAGLAALLLAPTVAQGELRAERIGWTELHYRASKLGFSVESRLELRAMDQPEIARALVDTVPGNWLPAPAQGGWLLHLETDGLGKHSRLELLIDRYGRSIQQTQVETGRRLKDHRDRTYRFGRDAVHTNTRKPKAEEVRSPHSAWSERSDWTQRLPDELPRDLVLGQSTGLFYTLAAAELNAPGDRVRTHVFAKGRVMQIDLVVEERELVCSEHLEEDDSGSRRRAEPVKALRIRLSARGLGQHSGDGDFRFMGLKGKVHVYVDEETRAPILITGRIGWLGRAKVKLERLVLGSH